MCAAARVDIPADAAGYLIGHNIAPDSVKSRLVELEKVSNMTARHGLNARRPEIMDIALRFDENPAQAVGALLALVLEESQPAISTHLPTGPMVRRGLPVKNTRTFRL